MQFAPLYDPILVGLCKRDISVSSYITHILVERKCIRESLQSVHKKKTDEIDNVIILNADKVRLTGKKMTDKVYVRYTGYPGGQRFTTPKEILAKKPTELVRMAVKGMLPKNRLGSKLLNNLYLYAGNEHPHQAQNPKTITLNEI